jgi:hypothetical protein
LVLSSLSEGEREMRLLSTLLLGLAACSAYAAPVLWTANISFSDGGTITGTFVFDADLGSDGTFSAIDITTQGGSSGIGPNAYFDLIQQSSFFIRIVPDTSAPSLSGQPVLTMAWEPAGGLTQYGVSPGLGNAGGLVQAIGAREEVCANADCTSVWGGPARLQNGFEGVFSGTTIPEPSSSVLVALGFLLIAARSAARNGSRT